MPGKKYASIQNPAQYRALKRQGFSKTAAAKITNAQNPPGKNTRGGRRKSR